MATTPMRSALRTVVIVALVLAVAAAAASMFAWSRAKPAPAAVEARLVAGHTIQRQALEQGRDALAASALQIAEDRAFAAYIVAALGRDVVDTVSIRDLLNERGAELGLDGSAVISAGGTVVVGTGALRTLAGRADGHPGVATALAQARPAAGFWHHDGTALQVALAPIRQGPLLEGLLVLGRPVDRAQVDQLARDSALDLHLMLGTIAGTLLASSDPQVGAGIIRAAVGRSGAAAAETPTPGRGGELASFDDGAWLHSTVPRRELEIQTASRQRLLLAAEIAAVVALLLAGVLALTRTGGALAGAGSGAPAQRRPESASQDQRRGRELEGWLSRRPASAPAGEPTATPAPGILLGERYQLLTTQDESVGASVHRALDRQQDKVVTLFCLKAGAPRETARNFRIGAECRRAMRVVHPNLARIVDVSQDRAMVMIAVETVAGVSLGELLQQQGPPPLQAGLLVAKRVCSALRELHEAGALIRRLDPDQVMFESDGRIRLLPVTAATVAEAMREGSSAGSSADQPSGRRADLQALGGLLRLLFTGRAGELPMSLPPELRTLIARCLAAGDGQGYGSAESVLTDLDRI